MRRLLAVLRALWRTAVTTQAVRDIESAGPEQGAHALPPLPPEDEPSSAGLREMDERLERIRRRNQELARLFARRREG